MVGARWQGVSHQLCVALFHHSECAETTCSCPETGFEDSLSLIRHERFTRRVVRFNVFVENLDKLGHDLVAFQSCEQAAVNVNGGFRFLGGSWERDPDICVLRFAGPIDYATHHCKFHLFDAHITAFP